jgi:hypothetical protein
MFQVAHRCEPRNPLFLGYGLIGFTGDYAVGLLAQDIDTRQEHQYDYDVAVEVDVDSASQDV